MHEDDNAAQEALAILGARRPRAPALPRRQATAARLSTACDEVRRGVRVDEEEVVILLGSIAGQEKTKIRVVPRR